MSEVNVPKLRFREFEGEWVEKRLGDLGYFKNGLNKSKKDFGHGFPFVNLMDVFGKSTILENNFGLVNANKKDLELYTLKKGDVLFIRSSVKKEGVGETALILNDLAHTTYSGFLIRFRDKNDDFDFLYKRYCFKTKRFRNSLLSLSTTSANTNINQESLSLLKIYLPQKTEQQKIANFLTSIDQKIEQLTKKEKLLVAYKEGVMQKIFSRQIRFRDDNGEVYGDWVDGKLGDYGKLIKGLTYSPDNISDNGLLVLRSSNIQNNQISFKDNVYVDLEVSDEVLTRENDILICVRNGSKRLIGKNIIIQGNLEKSTHGAFMTVFRGDSNKFIAHWFKTQMYYKEVHKNLGATINSINGSDLKKFKTFFPQKAEQTKIANFLSSIDKKIEQVNRQIEESKGFKKGLLQQMFV